MRHYLVLRRWCAEVEIDDMDSQLLTYRGGFLGVPLTMRNKPNCERIGALIRNLQEVGVGKDGVRTSV